eukprot:m.35687 g.35687  ORF g.35687 m.35687 type:complete len:659 (-) comp7461_c0_seq1:110-2086(-)
MDDFLGVRSVEVIASLDVAKLGDHLDRLTTNAEATNKSVAEVVASVEILRQQFDSDVKELWKRLTQVDGLNALERTVANLQERVSKYESSPPAPLVKEIGVVPSSEDRQPVPFNECLVRSASPKLSENFRSPSTPLTLPLPSEIRIADVQAMVNEAVAQAMKKCAPRAQSLNAVAVAANQTTTESHDIDPLETHLDNLGCSLQSITDRLSDIERDLADLMSNRPSFTNETIHSKIATSMPHFQPATVEESRVRPNSSERDVGDTDLCILAKAKTAMVAEFDARLVPIVAEIDTLRRDLANLNQLQLTRPAADVGDGIQQSTSEVEDTQFLGSGPLSTTKKVPPGEQSPLHKQSTNPNPDSCSARTIQQRLKSDIATQTSTNVSNSAKSAANNTDKVEKRVEQLEVQFRRSLSQGQDQRLDLLEGMIIGLLEPHLRRTGHYCGPQVYTISPDVDSDDDTTPSTRNDLTLNSGRRSGNRSDGRLSRNNNCSAAKRLRETKIDRERRISALEVAVATLLETPTPEEREHIRRSPTPPMDIEMETGAAASSIRDMTTRNHADVKKLKEQVRRLLNGMTELQKHRDKPGGYDRWTPARKSRGNDLDSYISSLAPTRTSPVPSAKPGVKGSMDPMTGSLVLLDEPPAQKLPRLPRASRTSGGRR